MSTAAFTVLPESRRPKVSQYGQCNEGMRVDLLKKVSLKLQELEFGQA